MSRRGRTNSPFGLSRVVLEGADTQGDCSTDGPYLGDGTSAQLTTVDDSAPHVVRGAGIKPPDARPQRPLSSPRTGAAANSRPRPYVIRLAGRTAASPNLCTARSTA